MLQNIRKYSNNFLTKSLLGLLIISFLIWGIGDILRAANKDYVAVVAGDQYISVIDFVEAKKKQLQQLREVYPNITPSQIKALNLDNTILNQLITNKLLELEIKDLGIFIDDSIVLTIITKNPMFQDENGNFDKELFKKILAYNNIPESDYVAQLKLDISNRMLIDSLSTQIIPSDNLINAINNYNNQTLNIDLVKVSIKNLKTELPSDKEIEEFYQKNTAKFTIPEYRDLQYLTITPEQYQSRVTISEQELQEEVDQNLKHASAQNLFDYYDVIFDSEQTAQEALTKLKQNNDFNKVVKELTTENAKEFLITKRNINDIPDNIRNIIINLKENQVSEIIKSDMGYHVIKLIKVVSAKIDVKQLKQDIEQYLINQKIEQLMYDDIKNIEDEISSGKSLEEISKQYKLPINSIGMIDTQGLDKKGQEHSKNPRYVNFVVEAFKLPKNQPSDLLNIDETKPGYYIISVTEIYSAQTQSLEQVRPQIVDELTLANKVTQATKIANELASKINTPEFTMSIKNYSPNVTVTSMNLPRPNESEIYHSNSVIPFATQVEIFELKPNEASKVFQTIPGDIAFAIARTLNKNTASLTKEEAKNIKNSLGYNLKSTIWQDFIRYLEQKYTVEIHSDILNQIED
jgi:peptidyl-prolyl cis-trans isomerase D